MATRAAMAAENHELPEAEQAGHEWKLDRIPGIDYVSHEEGIAILDRQARKRLGISGDEFIRKYCAGEIEDPCRSDVLIVAALIPLAKP